MLQLYIVLFLVSSRISFYYFHKVKDSTEVFDIIFLKQDICPRWTGVLRYVFGNVCVWQGAGQCSSFPNPSIPRGCEIAQ